MITILAIIALLLALLSPYVNPGVFTLPSLMAIAFPLLLLLNLVCALFWLCIRRRRYLAIAPAIMLLLSIPAIARNYAHGKQRQAKEHQLTILTYNTQRMEGVKKQDNNIIRYIKELNPDVVCLQEFETNKDSRYLTLQDVKDQLGYPYSYIDFKIYKSQRQFGLAVFSKYPLLGKQTIQYDTQANESDQCDIVVGTDTIRLFNNHLQSNRLTRDNIPENMNADEILSKSTSTYRQMRYAARLRGKQAKIVAAEIEKSPYPAVVVGDFNDTPLSYTYRKMSAGLNDAFLTSNNLLCGRGTTYRHYGLDIRIDYVLCSAQLTPMNCEVQHVDFSDHYPITCTLTW